MRRRRSIGAEVVDGGVSFRVWAPAHEKVAVVIDDRDYPLDREPNGYFSGLVKSAKAGTRYKFRLERDAFPDPASRFQPEGPHGPSYVVDPTAFRWTAKPPDVRRRVIYEMHIGTFTREGTFVAAIEHLAELAEIGINVLEVMPINEFAGRFGWGYDGVDLWAPFHVYGEPDDFRRFVDAAHARGLAVILDVVYNHLGPDGNYLTQFTPSYFTSKYPNDWGESVNFDDVDAHGVREFFAENAAYWIDEFHLDGLRLDATQSIIDLSGAHVTRQITDRARAAAGHREIFIVAENEPQDARLITEYGVDAMWNDDWHHSSFVALTGRIEAYYTDYRGRPQEFVSMARHGFLFQGQRYTWQKNPRGTPSHDIAPEHFVCFIENHDQVANTADGSRLPASGRKRAMTALVLLQPQTPMLFQGQEFGSTAPFLYFADHDPELARLVREGRREFMKQFPSIDVSKLAAPELEATFAMCKLDHNARDEEIVELHRSLLALRNESPFCDARRVEGAVLGEHCFLLRWLAPDDRLLIVNLGDALHFEPASEPLLAPPRGADGWRLLWTSDGSQRFDEWRIPAEAAIVLRPRDDSRDSRSNTRTSAVYSIA